MKNLLSGLLMTGFLLIGSAPYTEAEECANRHPEKVKKGHKDWKIAGLLFGQYDDNNSSYFFAGGGLPKEPGNHRPIKVKLNLQKKPDAANKIKTQLKLAPMAIHYGVPYLDHAGHLYDTYIALDAFQTFKHFEHTESHGFHQNEFKEACSIKRGKKEKKKRLSGYVIAVERKGFSGLTRSCNVMVNPGGTQKENRRELLYYREKETCRYYDNDWLPTCTTEKIPVYRYYQVDVPARTLLIAHSEEACRFAEDTGWAQVKVTIDYSVSKHSDAKNPNKTIIHKITVQEKTQHAPEQPDDEPDIPQESSNQS
ncbi:hypothetical protein [Parendozoicomonas sp. Alg238-R29]|uniref:hypothetical protein n=1 Tax=Parendozoicomonas sp. Alg238-R29 TaxID=2993446 RepID=UPI00248DA03D|nr:hypothetical protein [Parendozoicomonas sp. Alg238-R29]